MSNDHAPAPMTKRKRVIADWTGKPISGFAYTLDDICAVIRRTCDLAMPPQASRGTARVTSPDGFVTQHDNWTSWHVSRPFSDEEGACAWLRGRTRALRDAAFDADRDAGELSRSGKALQAVLAGPAHLAAWGSDPRIGCTVVFWRQPGCHRRMDKTTLRD